MELLFIILFILFLFRPRRPYYRRYYDPFFFGYHRPMPPHGPMGGPHNFGGPMGGPGGRSFGGGSRGAGCGRR